MLTMTTDAGEHLKGLLEQAEAPENAAARFVASDDGLSLHVDEPRPGDETIQHEGRTVLLLDAQIAELLADRTLDIEQTEEGPALTLQ